MTRRAPRLDANHKEIAAAFERLGWSVLNLSGVGNGCPDLLVARGGILRLVEVKHARGTLTPQQVEFQREFRAPVYLVRDYDDVLRVAGGAGMTGGVCPIHGGTSYLTPEAPK